MEWRNVFAVLCVVLAGASCDVTEFVIEDEAPEMWLQDVASSLDNGTHIVYMRGENVEKPLQCRRDVCPSSNITTEELGVFTWPTVTAGYKVTMLCPYSYTTPLYTTRICQLAAAGANNGSLAKWAEPDDFYCPLSPVNEVVRRMKADEWEMSGGDDYTSWTFYWVERVLEVAEDTEERYPSVNAIWARTLDNFVSLLIEDRAYENLRFTEGEIQQILQVFDLVHVDKYYLNGDTSTNAILNLANQFPVSTTGYYETRPVDYNFTRKPVTEKQLTLSSISERNELYMNVTLPEGAVDFTFSAVVLKGLYSLGFRPEIQIPRVAAILPQPVEPPIKIPAARLAVEEPVCEPVFPPFTAFEYHDEGAQRAIGALVHVTLSYRVIDPFTGEETAEYLDSDCQQRVTWTVTELGVLTTSNEEEVVCLVSPTDEEKQKNYAGQTSPVVVGNLVFYTGLCDTVRTYGEYAGMLMSVTCHCRAIGYITVIIPWWDEHIAPVDPSSTESTSTGSSFEETLGFAYNHGLFIASLVLGSVSAVCLILTILSYTIFSKLRRGSATRILLNLCMCILLTLVFMYVSLGLEFTKPGWKCCLYTSLKYYLVLLTLMWNGVEGVNMYLKLVKVFPGETTHFVLKAAVVAYGVPGVIIGIIFAVDHGAFRGTYEGCKYRCVFTPNELYFAYLIPLLFVMVANLFIFIAVMVTISKSRPGTSETKGHVKRYKARVIGAVSMLFLLGFPWLFSAFGALDASANEVTSVAEEVFQIIFMVLISLQGLFIFLFNCARQAHVREAWEAAISSKSTGSASISTRSNPSKPGGKSSTTQTGMTSSTASNVMSPDMQVGTTPAAARASLYSSFKAKKASENRANGHGKGPDADVIDVSVDVIDPDVKVIRNNLFDNGEVNAAYDDCSGSKPDVKDNLVKANLEVHETNGDETKDKDGVGA